MSLFGQTKSELEKERKKIISEISKTNGYLKSTQKEKSSTLKDLGAINQQVENRKALISNIKQDIEQASHQLKQNESKKDSINTAYQKLLQQYKGILRYSYIQELSNQKIAYLLSSESLNTFLLRYRYIKQFESFQKLKKEELNQLRALLVEADENIKLQQDEQERLLHLENEQYDILENEKESKNKILKSISKKESQLKSELKKKRNQREKLNKEIEKIILAQLKAAREKEKNANKSKVDSKLSADFSKNKGKLPWPIDNGFVSTKFGKQPHPTLKGITIESNGIDISCTGSMSVKAIFDGEVVGITKVVGSQNMIIVSHGNFYSVYSNLSEVVVRKGNKVTRGQLLGSLSSNPQGRGELHLELWQDKKKLNPQKWLKK